MSSKVDQRGLIGQRLHTVLDWWQASERRAKMRWRLRERDGEDPDVSGGTWGGCVYEVEEILRVLEAGKRALAAKSDAGGM